MATSFKRESRMMTTEPSVDEVGHGMKKGGHAGHKKHMAMGGNSMMGRPAPAMLRRPAPTPMAGAMPVMRKKGGMAEGGESKAQEKAEMHEMKKIEKELKHHESMKAGKAHHGLKNGGKAPKAGPAEMGGLLGGLEATREDKTRMTGGVRSPGYKNGGSLSAKGDAFQARSAMKPKIDVQDKVHEAKQGYAKQTKTMGVEGKGYKHGGKLHKFAKGGTVSQSVAGRYLNDMNDGEKMPTKKGKTGDINKKLDAYKHGGHVMHEHKMHHTTHGHDEHGHKAMHKHASKHEHHGHEKMEAHPMKHGGQAKHHTTKMSTHKKAGGMCNY